MPEKKFSLHVDPTGEVLTAARRCEADVFLEAYGNTAEQWREEYGPYDDASVFLVILDPADEAVACSRLILPNPAGLKSLVDTQREPWLIDANRSAASAGMVAALTCDIATLAVRRKVTGAGVLSAALYHGMVAMIRANRLRWVVMIMDARARRLLSMLNLETHVLPGTTAAPYLGSTASVPLYGDVPRMMRLQSGLNPDGHRMIECGVGLDSIAIPPTSDFVLRPRRLLTVSDFVPRGPEENDAQNRTLERGSHPDSDGREQSRPRIA